MGKNKKKKINRRNIRYTIHHIVPKSRCNGHCSELTVKLPEKFHNGWHAAVGNLYGKEIPPFSKELEKMEKGQEIVTELDIILLRERIKSRKLNESAKRR